MNAWQPISTAPMDGTTVWVFLYETNIRKAFYETSEQGAERIGCEVDTCDPAWVDANDPTEDWRPEWWLPLDALPEDPQ